MGNPFQGLTFQYPFRDYQRRALAEVHLLMKDDKLNIIAAPGAGKTILALQVMIELGEPALILAPTVALRQQWIDRFTQDFSGKEDISALVSDDLYTPNLVTVSTYQALYSAYASKKEDKTALLEAQLKAGKVKAVILDEAHHLKKVWLDAASDLVERLGARTVSLTATPPYDIKPALWNRYISLCGDIDIEIPVAELVKQKDLAPHQDFIYFNSPSQEQVRELDGHREKFRTLFQELLSHTDLIAAVSLHDMIINPEGELNTILDSFDYYLVLLKYLHYNKVSLPESSLVPVKQTLATFSVEDMETLLTYCLVKDKKSYVLYERFFKDLQRQLNALGAIEEGQVSLRYNADVRKLLSQNAGKLSSVTEIVRLEREMLGEKLKLVVISELIFKSALDLQEEESFHYIGVIPLLMHLVRESEEKVIVLTGELIIIPLCLEEALRAICREAGIEEKSVYVEALRFHFDYGRVEFSGTAQKKAVSILTKLFQQSEAGVLIGSNAYIGEGWDAPFINALIMASTISSFVSSNQIRGRAIRVCPDDPEKCANIWHLVCMEQHLDGKLSLGKDFEMLQQRFQAFEGLYRDKDRIDCGVERLHFPSPTYTPEEMKQLNAVMVESAGNRPETIARWERALKNYRHERGKPVTGLSQPQTMEAVEQLGTWKYRLRRFWGGLFKNPGLYLFWKGAPIYQVGEAILQTLIHMELIRPEVGFSIVNQSGEAVIQLQNTLFREQRLFYTALQEMLRPPENPRYLIVYKEQHFQVPEIMGRNKQYVEFLAQRIWPRYGYTLFYTRTPEGRKKMLEIKLRQSGVEIRWVENENKPCSPLDTQVTLQVLKDELSKHAEGKG